MNETLNFTRFLLLVKRQWTENKTFYLLLWGIISLCLVLLNIFSDNHSLDALYIFLFSFGGCAMTVTLFSNWKDTGRSSFFLLLPASTTEKFLTGLFYGLFMYILVYAVNFLFIRIFVTCILVLLFPNNLVPFSQEIREGMKEIVSMKFSFYMVAFLTFMFFQSLCMICMIRFKRWQVFYFLFILFAILFIYNLGMHILILNNLDYVGHAFIRAPGFILTYYSPDFSYLDTSTKVQEFFSFLKPIRNINFLVWLVIFSLIYMASLFSLKERELK
ncbi:MAG: hypothetical protein Q8867_10365 [Bacteroidota bacterium]|nr:hypothetical protein [Bacteroidota bacterium]